jgi:hypothetical protein
LLSISKKTNKSHFFRILSPYITCPSDTWDGSSGPLREKININGQQQAVVNENGNNNNNNKKGLGTFSEYLQPIAKKLYAANEKVLNSSALVREFISFQKCIESLQRPYDMREFVGGMSKFNNMKFQMQSVQVARYFPFLIFYLFYFKLTNCIFKQIFRFPRKFYGEYIIFEEWRI